MHAPALHRAHDTVLVCMEAGCYAPGRVQAPLTYVRSTNSVLAIFDESEKVFYCTMKENAGFYGMYVCWMLLAVITVRLVQFFRSL